MFKRFKTGLVALGAITALGLGGAAIAGAQSSPSPSQASAAQVGDQTAPDQPGATENAPETAAASETASSETPASESAPSDGPGGYADSNASANTQQEGVN